MKNSLKLMCIILVFAFVLAAFSACDKPAETSKDASSSAEGDTSSAAESSADEVSSDPDAKWKDANGRYTTGFTKEELGDTRKTFTVLVQGNNAVTYQNVDFTTGEENTTTFYGTFIDDAVTERARMVDEEFGVKVIGLKVDSPINTARTEALASTDMFDCMLFDIGYLTSLCEEDSLAELTAIEGFQIDAPWWDEGATEAFSIKNKLYFTTGDITLMNKIQTTSILFNKTLISDMKLDNPYDLVRSHEWTLDKILEMSRSVPEDSANQIHGLLTGHNDMDGWYISFGGKYCEKDADDIPFLAVKQTSSVNAALKMLEEFTQRGNFILYAQECPAPIWDTSFAEFYEGRCLFRYSGFSAANKMRDHAVDFGIVPVPLLDESQENYISAAGVAGGVAILKNHPDVEWVAKMINICAAGAKTFITPAYYEVALKTRDARDNDSEEMLDLIFENLYYDIGYVYNFGGICNVLTTLSQKQSTGYVAEMDGVVDAAQTALEKSLSSYD